MVDQSELSSARRALECLRLELESDLKTLHAAVASGKAPLELVAQLEDDLARVEAAFQRLHTGRYGYCTGCGNEIELNRLRADPTSALCTDCSRRVQRCAGHP